MTKSTWFALWGVLFILCAGLGFIPTSSGVLRFFMILLSVCFFVPPGVLLYQADREGDRQTAVLIRNLSAASLGLTVVILTANFLSLMAPEAVGNVLYAMLVIVSSPMVCGQYWVLSLFLWACLLSASFVLRKRCVNNP